MCVGDYFFFGGGCDTVWFGRKLVLLGSAQLDAKKEPLSSTELPADLNTAFVIHTAEKVFSKKKITFIYASYFTVSFLHDIVILSKNVKISQWNPPVYDSLH